MSFIRFWIGATIIGLGMTSAILIWALRRRQFKESDRAAHLPLQGVDEQPPQTRRSRDAAALVGVLGIGATVVIVTIIVSLSAP